MNYAGYKGKVTIGKVTVASMNRWNLPGMRNEIIEKTVFEDAFKKFVYGITEGGNAEFSGFWDAEDSTGQAVLKAAAENKTLVKTLRFYYGALASQFFHLTPGAEALMEELVIGEADLSGLVPVSFRLKISGGYMARVYNVFNATDISFTHNASADDTINKTGGASWAGYFLAGQDIIVEGSTSNDTDFTIKAAGVAANVLTLVEDTVVTEAAGDDVSIMSFPI